MLSFSYSVSTGYSTVLGNLPKLGLNVEVGGVAAFMDGKLPVEDVTPERYCAMSQWCILPTNVSEITAPTLHRWWGFR